MKGSLLVSVLLLPILTFQVGAQEIPRFSIEKICASAQVLTPDDKTPVETRLTDERAAERQLHESWAKSNPQHRQTCAAETQIGGSPSYVDVLTCLQMSPVGHWIGADSPVEVKVT